MNLCIIVQTYAYKQNISFCHIVHLGRLVSHVQFVWGREFTCRSTHCACCTYLSYPLAACRREAFSKRSDVNIDPICRASLVHLLPERIVLHPWRKKLRSVIFEASQQWCAPLASSMTTLHLFFSMFTAHPHGFRWLLLKLRMLLKLRTIWSIVVDATLRLLRIDNLVAIHRIFLTCMKFATAQTDERFHMHLCAAAVMHARSERSVTLQLPHAHGDCACKP